LDKIVALLVANPKMKIEFCSFTDSRGSDDYNMELSKQRTEASIKYLTSKGVSKKSIVGKWLGESQLVNECANGVNCSETKHKENRRTEIKILSM
jgi:peptidoglycan-associated lipoprotein